MKKIFFLKDVCLKRLLSIYGKGGGHSLRKSIGFFAITTRCLAHFSCCHYCFRLQQAKQVLAHHQTMRVEPSNNQVLKRHTHTSSLDSVVIYPSEKWKAEKNHRVSCTTWTKRENAPRMEKGRWRLPKNERSSPKGSRSEVLLVKRQSPSLTASHYRLSDNIIIFVDIIII